ncbi:MAG: formimidoylglutamase [Bacteroidetes bacterium]|nr:formimidoylglutamase [Bacteroidota bacterium]
MLDAFFTPVPQEIWAPHRGNEESFGGRISVHAHAFPNLRNKKIVMMGDGYPADEVRKQLYGLFWRFDNLEVADLGNLVNTGDEVKQQFAMSEALGELLQQDCVVIVLGNRRSGIYAQYKGYRQSKEPVEIVKVSPDVDLEEGSPLRQILIEKPGYLFNIDFIGTQNYYISNQTAALLDKMYFENHRLGEIRAAIEETEPILRSAHMLMFDMNAIRSSDAPGTWRNSPNGLYAEEAARICRYAGISNKLSSAYFYGLNQEEPSQTTHVLLAQMVWYFIEGVTARFYDHPVHNHSDFLIYRNRLSSTGHEIVFYKSRKSNRWWMEIPHPYEKHTFFIGCSYKDYEMVCEDEMPDRWWRAYQRLM